VQIVFRAARDIRPMQIFGLLSALFVVPAVLAGAFIGLWFLRSGNLYPFDAVLPLSAAALVAGFVLFLMALIAEMVSVHRGLSEELLYLARQRLYARRGAARAMAVAKTSPNQIAWQVPAPGVQVASHDVPPVRSLNPRSTVVATEATATSAMHHGGLHLTEG